MALLVDASVFITLERRGVPPSDVNIVVPGESLVVASMTAAELLIGVHRADTPARRLRRATYVEGVLSLLPLVPFDLDAARAHAQVWAHLAVNGAPIGPNDLIIAATALSRGHQVLTDNLREFQRVPGLVVRQPDWPDRRG
ncbi:MAG: PIN domain-containing protein [Thermomicrobiales bacterium]